MVLSGKIQDVLYRWHFPANQIDCIFLDFQDQGATNRCFKLGYTPEKLTRAIILPTQTMHYMVSFDPPGLVIWWPLSLTVKPKTEGLEDDFRFQCSWICSGPKWRGLREARKCSWTPPRKTIITIYKPPVQSPSRLIFVVVVVVVIIIIIIIIIRANYLNVIPVTPTFRLPKHHTSINPR